MIRIKSLAIILCLVFVTSIIIPGINPEIASAASYDITSYGATANDDTDDTSAIQGAINAATVGDMVYIPKGTFNVSATINVKSGVKIEGQSQDGAILKFTGTTALNVLIQLNGTSDVELTKFTIDGNSNDNLHNGIWGEPVSRALIHFITIKDLTWHDAGAFGPHGLLLSAASDSEVSDNTFINMGVLSGGGSGMRIGYSSSGIKILRNNISNTGEGGIRCNVNSTDFIIRENIVTGSGLVKEGLSIECYSGCQRFIIEDNVVDTFLSVAGCDYSAVRRNIISDKSGRHMTNGLEAASSNNIYTDNIIDDGHTVGLSASWEENYQFFGYNTFSAANMWGAQLQGGDSSHLVKTQYFYKNDFINQTMGEANPPYPGYEGYGFRINGNTDYIEFENCNFNNNARYGLQFGGSNVNHISLRNCNIRNNGEGAFEPNWTGYTGFEMEKCNVNGNGNNNIPALSDFDNQRPVAVMNYTDAGAGTINFSSSSVDPDGTIAHVLWDFGDGVPSDSTDVSHTYSVPGDYRVTLVVWDNLGRAERIEKTISINDNIPTPGDYKLKGRKFATSGIDLGEGNEKCITKIRFIPRESFENRMVGGRFQGSNISQTKGYEDLYTVADAPVNGWNEITIDNPTEFRYLRYISPNESYAYVADFEYYSEPVPTPTPTPEIKLSGTTFGTMPSWNNDPNTTYDKAFDGNTFTFFDYANGDGGYTGIDLGAGNEHKITKIKFYPRATFEYRMPGGKFQGSNTSSSSGYTDLYTISTTPANGWNEVTIDIPGGFRYLRYLSPTGSYGNIAEVEFYGEPASPETPSITFIDDFNDGNADGWTTYANPDTWAVENSQYSVQSGPGDKSVANGTNFSDFTYEADVVVESTYDAGVIFRVTNPSTGSDSFNGYYFGISAASDQVVLAKMSSGIYNQIASSTVTMEPDTIYHLKVITEGSSIKIYVNDVLCIDAVDSTWTSGAIGVRSYFTHAHFDNIVVSN